ncbi:glucosidase [Pontiella sp.]|uniref:MGH1-like glycoside hydrolase domain-containing protein n=1 Tax=Pontiella sp. TaxID=2837462 RepID=UPI00356777BA
MSEASWKKWGPYLSERQWGTVREDYSVDGNAWDYLPFEHARSRAYRRGEDGLAGLSDDRQLLCFSVALWNGKDPCLKERAFGLSNEQGNHGEDGKDYYFYLDSTPTHSYLKYLYKYPQREFPYADLKATNLARSKKEMEYELLDTGIFDEDRYFDVFVEYAKAGPEDILVKIGVCNRGPEVAALRVLPTLWFRNVWAWEPGPAPRPMLAGTDHVRASHPELGEYRLYFEGSPPLRYTENETNQKRLFDSPNAYPYTKDGIDDFVVSGNPGAVNAENVGTKVAADYALEIPPGETRTLRMRLTQAVYAAESDAFGPEFETVFGDRRAECDAFYRDLLPASLSADERAVARQALAGMLWSKQYYEYDVKSWLQEHAREGLAIRNSEWGHLRNHDVVSMPDKWEYPWYATWDLAFHTIALVLVDEAFAKQQLLLFLDERYQHPDGQLPAYEWNFSDVNPPVHPFAVFAVYSIDKTRRGDGGDTAFLRQAFDRLALNFNWWLAKKDPTGKNVFEGGFLGLDNIGVFDRSKELPTGGALEQSDGTAWMVLFAQFMVQIALELARTDPERYDDEALRYLDHFISIAGMMDRPGINADEMWDEDDGFFYDVLRFPDGSGTRLKVRSLVGLLPLCASTVIDADLLDSLPHFKERYLSLIDRKGALVRHIACPDCLGVQGRRLLGVLDDEKLRRVLSRMLDENEFLGPHGIRSLSRFHAEHPYTFHWNGVAHTVEYMPAESDSGLFGGNSNWRGPVWMPINFLILRALRNLYTYYGDAFTIECPTGSGQLKTLHEIERELGRRLIAIFLKNDAGTRPLYGGNETFQRNPHWRDHLLFYEYFHGDNGAGIGAAHQTGWTGLVAVVMAMQATISPEVLLDEGMKASADL